ncbi:MAG TPA: acetyl-CoA carboxylase biotin carboxyl carrier protein [Terriglobia bacterium]|nr:acetyl-CoA carboxylase biotin carboxyl carrier protein [Terriglobia bacterium]
MPGKNPPRNVPEPGRVWNLNDIQELLDLLAVKEITEFEIEQQGVKLRVRRGNAYAPPPGKVLEGALAPGPATEGVAPLPVRPASGEGVLPPPAAAAVTPETAAESTEGLFVMKSPIVGTFYSAPSPNAPPFAKIGDTVQVGQVICIIEAMKLMNELEAEVAGQIVRTYVENGQPVEYGQSLFAIEPARKK